MMVLVIESQLLRSGSRRINDEHVLLDSMVTYLKLDVLLFGSFHLGPSTKLTMGTLTTTINCSRNTRSRRYVKNAEALAGSFRKSYLWKSSAHVGFI